MALRATCIVKQLQSIKLSATHSSSTLSAATSAFHTTTFSNTSARSTRVQSQQQSSAKPLCASFALNTRRAFSAEATPATPTDADATPAAADEVTALKAQVAELTAKCTDLADQRLRAMAETENVRTRNRTDLTNARLYAIQGQSVMHIHTRTYTCALLLTADALLLSTI